MNPAVHPDFMHPALANFLQHFRMQYQAHGWNKERRGHMLAVQQFQDARQAGRRAILALRHRNRQRPSPEERFVVDVERKRDRDARTVGPGLRCQLAAGARNPSRPLNFFRTGMRRDRGNQGRLSGSLRPSANRTGEEQGPDQCQTYLRVFHDVGSM